MKPVPAITAHANTSILIAGRSATKNRNNAGETLSP
jgi:hypothetical protein